MNFLMDRLLNMEKEYVKLFSDAIEDDRTIRYIDPLLPDMYSHNFVFYKPKQGLVEFIASELNKAETKSSGFLRIETPYPIDADLLDTFPIKPRICLYDIMYIETKKFKDLKGNPDCRIAIADSKETMEDGILVDIAANHIGMGLEFAKRRILRKSQEYMRDDKPIQLFVCYQEDTPIGNIEYMPLNGIVKLEDFDILESYQRKGFGTAVLKYLLEKANVNKIEHAYLITDNSDSAKEMYMKCGFEKVGKKRELLFHY